MLTSLPVRTVWHVLEPKYLLYYFRCYFHSECREKERKKKESRKRTTRRLIEMLLNQPENLWKPTTIYIHIHSVTDMLTYWTMQPKKAHAFIQWGMRFSILSLSKSVLCMHFFGRIIFFGKVYHSQFDARADVSNTL